MALTNAEALVLKASILAQTDPAFLGYIAEGNPGMMAEYYNSASSFVVWDDHANVDNIFGAVNWKRFTVADSVPASNAASEVDIFKARVLQAQSQHMSLIALLRSGLVPWLNAAPAGINTGIKDALQNLPTGAGNTILDAGWVAVRASISRPASRFEALFSTGTGTEAAPGNCARFGNILAIDIQQAQNAV